MSFDWPIVRLVDVTSVLGDGLHGTPKYDEGGEYYFINGNNLSNGKIVFNEKTKRCTKEEYLKHKKDLNERTILVSINGTLGNVALYQGEKVFLGKSACYFNVNDESDRQFIRYVVSGPVFQSYIDSLATGSTIKNVSLKLMREFQFKLPPIGVQKSISKVLKDLDDKIELNRQTNQTLEAIAQAIFKSWFVDFEPTRAKIAAKHAAHLRAEGKTDDETLNAILQGEPEGKPRWTEKQAQIIAQGDPERAAIAALSGGKGFDELSTEQFAELKETAGLFPDELVDSELGELPNGWEVDSFQKIATLNTTSIKPNKEPERLWEHFSIPAFDVDEAPKLELGIEIKSNKYKVNKKSILSSKLNPNTPRTWWPDITEDGSAICSTEFMQFIPINHEYRAFVYGMIVSRPFQEGILKRVTGSTGSRQRAQPPQVANMDIMIPSEELIAYFSSSTENLYNKKAKNIKQNLLLAKTRDLLLPKLLSGELKVNSAELSAHE